MYSTRRTVSYGWVLKCVTTRFLAATINADNQFWCGTGKRYAGHRPGDIRTSETEL